MTLDDIEALLQDAMRQSKQTSLGRRMPAPAALPRLRAARQQLRAHVAQVPRDARAWRLLALAEETLLAYPRAIEALERAVKLDGQPTRRDLKRLAALRGAQGQWSNLRLTPVQLQELGTYLETHLASDEPHADGLHCTRTWLAERFADADVRAILAAFAARGGGSDDDVLDNIVRGGAV